MSKFDAEKAMWGRDVDAKAAELVRRGVPPYEAVEQARQAVSRSRQLAGMSSGDIESHFRSPRERR